MRAAAAAARPGCAVDAAARSRPGAHDQQRCTAAVGPSGRRSDRRSKASRRPTSGSAARVPPSGRLVVRSAGGPGWGAAAVEASASGLQSRAAAGGARRTPAFYRGRTAVRAVLVDDVANRSLPAVGSLPQFLGALWAFSRPHTIWGTLLSVLSISSLAVARPEDLTARFAAGVAAAVVPALLMNVCIVGFNQITDVEIDKVNKPYLPLASGEFSERTAWTLVLGTGAAALALGAASGSLPLLLTLVGSLALGIAYSADVPFLRWKRFPLLAASCILVVRAVAVQFGFYLHASSAVLGRPPALGGAVVAAAAFMCLFSLVIAFFKDIPDVEGDRRSTIRTLSVRFGEQRVFDLCIGLLLAAYAGAVGAGQQLAEPVCRVVVTGAHLGLAAWLWARSRQVDTRSRDSITAFYMFIWKLFYVEYALFPFFR